MENGKYYREVTDLGRQSNEIVERARAGDLLFPFAFDHHRSLPSRFFCSLLALSLALTSDSQLSRNRKAESIYLTNHHSPEAHLGLRLPPESTPRLSPPPSPPSLRTVISSGYDNSTLTVLLPRLGLALSPASKIEQLLALCFPSKRSASTTLPPSLFLSFPKAMVPNTQTSSSSSSSNHPHTRAPSPSPTLAHDAEDERAPKVSTSSPSPTPEAPFALPPSSVEKEEQHLGGTGSIEDPYIVGWQPDEPEDPYNWSKSKK